MIIAIAACWELPICYTLYQHFIYCGHFTDGKVNLHQSTWHQPRFQPGLSKSKVLYILLIVSPMDFYRVVHTKLKGYDRALFI